MATLDENVLQLCSALLKGKEDNDERRMLETMRRLMTAKDQGDGHEGTESESDEEEDVIGSSDDEGEDEDDERAIGIGSSMSSSSDHATSAEAGFAKSSISSASEEAISDLVGSSSEVQDQYRVYNDADMFGLSALEKKTIFTRNVDARFISFLDGKSLAEIVLKSDDLKDSYWLSSFEYERNGKRFYSSDVVQFMNNLLMEREFIADDRLEIFDSFLYQIIGDILALYEIHRFGKPSVLNTKFIEYERTELPNLLLKWSLVCPMLYASRHVYNSIMFALKKIFKRYVLDTFTPSLEPIVLVPMEPLKLKQEMERFVGFALGNYNSVLYSSKKSRIVGSTHRQLIEKLKCLRHLKRDFSLEAYNMQVSSFTKIFNKGGLSIPNAELTNWGLRLLEIIRNRVNIERDGNEAVILVRAEIGRLQNKTELDRLFLDAWCRCAGVPDANILSPIDLAQVRIIQAMLTSKVANARTGVACAAFYDAKLSKDANKGTLNVTPFRPALNPTGRISKGNRESGTPIPANNKRKTAVSGNKKKSPALVAASSS